MEARQPGGGEPHLEGDGGQRNEQPRRLAGLVAQVEEAEKAALAAARARARDDAMATRLDDIAMRILDDGNYDGFTRRMSEAFRCCRCRR